MRTLWWLAVSAALLACGDAKGGADRAPSPSAVTEAAPQALGAKAASQVPLDAGHVGRPVELPPDLHQAPSGESAEDGGVNL